MVKWYNNEHRHLPGDDLPTNSTSCKSVYRQMALTIPGGRRGRGKWILLPGWDKNVIRTLFTDKEGTYIGLTNEEWDAQKLEIMSLHNWYQQRRPTEVFALKYVHLLAYGIQPYYAPIFARKFCPFWKSFQFRKAVTWGILLLEFGLYKFPYPSTTTLRWLPSSGNVTDAFCLLFFSEKDAVHRGVFRRWPRKSGKVCSLLKQDYVSQIK
jgi:hypothetical protein